MTKNKGIIAQSAQHNRIHSLNRTVLINERSMKDRGNIGVIKGHQKFVTIEINIIPKKECQITQGQSAQAIPLLSVDSSFNTDLWITSSYVRAEGK